MNKIRMYVHAKKALHFLRWEMPYFRKYFDLVDMPSPDTVLFAFGPDVLESGAFLPANLRVALLFPGFGYNPYHNLVHRYGMQRIIEENYAIVFANPGPIAVAFADLAQLRLCSFSVDADLIGVRRLRRRLDSLIHISADAAQKDWTRSRDVMRFTNLRYEVFPPRQHTPVQRVWNRLRLAAFRKGVTGNTSLLHMGYESHAAVIRKYTQYDGFVHVAAETPPHVDGKYTATLLEAGLTGSILFWHDTLNLGNDFETVFSLPVDTHSAAQEILSIRDSINIELHSKRTSEEVYERVNPASVMRSRLKAIEEVLL